MNRVKEQRGVKYTQASDKERSLTFSKLYYSIDLTTFNVKLYQTLSIMRTSVNEALKGTVYKPITGYRLSYYCSRDIPMIIGSRIMIGRVKDIRVNRKRSVKDKRK